MYSVDGIKYVFTPRTRRCEVEQIYLEGSTALKLEATRFHYVRDDTRSCNPIVGTPKFMFS